MRRTAAAADAAPMRPAKPTHRDRGPRAEDVTAAIGRSAVARASGRASTDRAARAASREGRGVRGAPSRGHLERAARARVRPPGPRSPVAQVTARSTPRPEPEGASTDSDSTARPRRVAANVHHGLDGTGELGLHGLATQTSQRPRPRSAATTSLGLLAWTAPQPPSWPVLSAASSSAPPHRAPHRPRAGRAASAGPA